MGTVEQRVDAVCRAAEAGDVDAKRELGRLLCLLPVDKQRWPGEVELSEALAARPDDPESAVLLAARLVQQMDLIYSAFARELEPDELGELDGLQPPTDPRGPDIGHVSGTHRPLDRSDPCGSGDGSGADQAAVQARDPKSIELAEVRLELARKRREATELYERVLAAHPAHPAARAGLAALRDVPAAAFTSGGYSHYLVQGDFWSGSSGGRERLVVADAEELRWACEYWFAELSAFRIYELSVHTAGERVSTINLEALARNADDSFDWSRIDIPPLPTTPLPPGHPVRVDGSAIQYGWGLLQLG
ncbi:hypothetical protein E0L36_19035 [Streptomyces sp. AJS327]|uniref:hypothetical protein n=1 Tax=Streptomyces sp. AJS327 TaxID=2545265 RepID=UPI0015DE7287|nr:hypothetical protein [Streptomyces sp. AJS327]MBA0052891.1 hypothetical protein [Streptomyces sp. AJS327]